FGLQGAMQQRMLATPSTKREEQESLATALKQNTQSCRATAWGLDRLYTGTDKRPADLTQVFDRDAFVAAGGQAVTQRKNRIWHFNIPSALRVGRGREADNLGHHWVIELTQGAKAPEVRILASFEAQYTLAQWLGKKGPAARAAGAGGATMTV